MLGPSDLFLLWPTALHLLVSFPFFSSSYGRLRIPYHACWPSSGKPANEVQSKSIKELKIRQQAKSDS